MHITGRIQTTARQTQTQRLPQQTPGHIQITAHRTAAHHSSAQAAAQRSVPRHAAPLCTASQHSAARSYRCAVGSRNQPATGSHYWVGRRIDLDRLRTGGVAGGGGRILLVPTVLCCKEAQSRAEHRVSGPPHRLLPSRSYPEHQPQHAMLERRGESIVVGVALAELIFGCTPGRQHHFPRRAWI